MRWRKVISGPIVRIAIGFVLLQITAIGCAKAPGAFKFYDEKKILSYLRSYGYEGRYIDLLAERRWN